MKDNTKNTKLSIIISIFSIIICIVAVIISVLNLRYSAVSGKATWSAIVLLCCTITILSANLTIFISSYNKYKKSSK
ncbi:MAG: hypothetical protein K0S01_2126 [Herbinix sp.]|jgi:hypothetical protein|nr:hypothetical protein [Herbinix sp.]